MVEHVCISRKEINEIDKRLIRVEESQKGLENKIDRIEKNQNYARNLTITTLIGVALTLVAVVYGTIGG